MGKMIKDQKFYRMPAIVRVLQLDSSVHDFPYPRQADGLQSFYGWVRAMASNHTVYSVTLFFNGQHISEWRKSMGVMSDAQEQYADLKYKGQRFFVGDDGKNILEVLELKFNIVDVKLDTSGKYGPRYNVLINMEDAIPISKQGEIVEGKLTSGILPEMTISLPTNGQRDKMYEAVSHELEIKDFTVEHDPPVLMYGPCVVASEGKRKEIVEYKGRGKAKKLRPGNDEGFIYDGSEEAPETEAVDPFLPEPDMVQ
jgi:hypothetical protein